MAVILQVALDFVDLHRAVKVAGGAIEGGCGLAGNWYTSY